MLDTHSKVLRFDKFSLDLARCAIFRGDEQLPLRRQSFEVLRHLAEHSGEVVTRDALIKAVWTVAPARPEDSLFQCIKDVRRMLGEEARWIVRSVPGLGYQFMAEVSAVEEERPSFSEGVSRSPPQAGAPTPAQSHSHAAPRRWRRALVAVGVLITVLAGGSWFLWRATRHEPPQVLTMMAVPSLAVVPWGADPAEAKGARALADDLGSEIPLQNLGWMLALKSAAAYRGQEMEPRLIGRQLGARYLLMVSLRREGGQPLGTAALVEAETGRQLWTRSFRYSTPEDRKYAVARLAAGVPGSVVTTEVQRPLPAMLEAGHYAQRAYILLSNQRSPENTRVALALLEKALEADPNWVPALIGYGWALFNEFYRSDAESLAKGERAVERAIKVAPRNPAIYERRAHLLRVRGDSYGAIAASEHALTVSPSLASAHAELGRNKIDVGLAREAIAHIEEAIRLAPVHNSVHHWWWWAGMAALRIGEKDSAVRWLEKARQGNPVNTNPVPWLAAAYAMTGRDEEARTLLAEHTAKTPGFTVSGWVERFTRRNAVATAQFAPIAEAMRRLAATVGGPH